MAGQDNMGSFTTLISCPSCGLIQRPPQASDSHPAAGLASTNEPLPPPHNRRGAQGPQRRSPKPRRSPPTRRPRCARCGSRIGPRRASSDNFPAAMLSLAGLIMFPWAIGLPFLRIEQLGSSSENSLLGGIWKLLTSGDEFVGLVVLMFSLVLPPLKLLVFLALSWRPERLSPRLRSLCHRGVELAGRWGMLDVLFVAVLLAFVKLGHLVSFEAGFGLIAFGLFVVLSLAVGLVFDPHGLWETPWMPISPERDEPSPSAATDLRSKPSPPAAPASDSSSLFNVRTAAATPATPLGVAAPDTGQVKPAPAPSTDHQAEAWPYALTDGQWRQRQRRQTARPSVWRWLWSLAPLGVTLLIVAWLIWAPSQGVLVTIRFSQGHGIKPGDPLMHRGIEAGRVEKVALADDLTGVRVEVRLSPEANDLARVGSQFWVVRPQLDINGVAGLETLLGAKHISVLPGPADAPRAWEFVGRDDPPPLDLQEPGGLEIVLQAPASAGLRPGTPVEYRDLRIGSVVSVNLASDGGAVEARVYIRPNHVGLIRTNTRFWRSGGIRASGGLSGLTLEVPPLDRLLTAGIEAAVPDPPGPLVRPGRRFVLEDAPPENARTWRPVLSEPIFPTTPNFPTTNPPSWAAGTAPRVISAALSWNESVVLGMGSRSRDRLGLVIVVPGGLLGPLDLLGPPTWAKGGAAALRLAEPLIPGQTPPAPNLTDSPWPMGPLLAVRRLPSMEAPPPANSHASPHNSTTSLESGAPDHTQTGSVASKSGSPANFSQLPHAWPLERCRRPGEPEDCWVVGTADQPARFLAAARLSSSPEPDRWRIDPALSPEAFPHGAAVLAVSDGRLIGVVVRPPKESVAWVAWIDPAVLSQSAEASTSSPPPVDRVSESITSTSSRSP